MSKLQSIKHPEYQLNTASGKFFMKSTLVTPRFLNFELWMEFWESLDRHMVQSKLQMREFQHPETENQEFRKGEPTGWNRGRKKGIRFLSGFYSWVSMPSIIILAELTWNICLAANMIYHGLKVTEAGKNFKKIIGLRCYEIKATRVTSRFWTPCKRLGIPIARWNLRYVNSE